MNSTDDQRHTVDALPQQIRQPYLLLTSIPFFVDDEDSVWLDPLWHRDFVRHFDYLKHLILAAPCIAKKQGQDGLVRVDPPHGVYFSVIGLPRLESFVRTLLKLPTLLHRLWLGIGQADIVHSGIVGWPIPLGWLANPIALLRRKKLILVIESAPWRQSGDIQRSWVNRIRGALTESLGRFFVNRAGLVFFTQPSYRQTLMTNGRGEGHVVPATWINGEEVLTESAVEASWVAKQVTQSDGVRYLFASRLTEQKGVRILLEALRLADQTGMGFTVDVIGDGALRQECVEAKSSFTNLNYSVLDPVPYGQPFFELVRRYHALIVPTVSDEQPRIIFDANSQGVPIIAFDTDGTRPFISHPKTGWLVAIGDAKALSDQMRACAEAPQGFRACGSNALKFAQASTHEQMHLVRWQLIRKWLDQ